MVVLCKFIVTYKSEWDFVSEWDFKLFPFFSIKIIHHGLGLPILELNISGIILYEFLHFFHPI